MTKKKKVDKRVVDGFNSAFRHSPESPTWPPYKPRPDGSGPNNKSQMPRPKPT